MNTSLQRNSEAIKHVLGVSNLRTIRESDPLTVCRGEGAYIFDENGKDYLEACSSFYCAGLGYGCQEEILDAIVSQVRKLSFCVSASSRTTDTTVEFAERLAALVPIHDARILFGCSGSEANDFLIKMLRYREILKGGPERRKIISRHGGYHGGTIATTALGGDSGLHESFGLRTTEQLYVSQPDYFNGSLLGESEADYVSRLADELTHTIELSGPETISAFFIEPVNFSCGFLPPPSGYLSRIADITKRYGITLIADEIVTGFGRTGKLFGSEAVGLAPDCLTLGKAMSGAYFPMSAAVIDRDLYDWLERGSDTYGTFGHASTFAGHPIGAAIGLKILEIFEERNLLAHIQLMASRFRDGLMMFKGHPFVDDIRCLGLAGAIQLRSSDSASGVTKASKGMSSKVAEICLRNGLLLRVNGPNLIMAPPLTITEREMEDMFDRLAQVFRMLTL